MQLLEAARINNIPHFLSVSLGLQSVKLSPNGLCAYVCASRSVSRGLWGHITGVSCYSEHQGSVI